MPDTAQGVDGREGGRAGGQGLVRLGKGLRGRWWMSTRSINGQSVLRQRLHHPLT